MKLGKQPAAPDPLATANAQSGMNRDTAITQQNLNMVNQQNPWGSVVYDQTGTKRYQDSQGNWREDPTFTQTTTYNPAQQAIFDSTTAAQGNLANLAQSQSAFLNDYLSQPFSFNDDDAAQWAYDLASPRILGQQAQNEDSLRTTLANKGIREGSAAWNAEMGRLTNANTDQLNQLALTGRGQAYNEALTGRSQPINEIIGLMSGTQLQTPGSGSPAAPQASVGGVDYTGLVNQNYQNQVNATNQGNAAMGGLFGSVLGLFSDIRLKTDINHVGYLNSGLPVYDFRYKSGSVADDGGQLHRGVMAQDVAKMFPNAVIYTPNGMMVKYGEIC